MQKIIANEPFEDTEPAAPTEEAMTSAEPSEESKSASPEEIKVEIVGDPKIKKAIHDSTRYTVQQMEVLELLDSSTELTAEQRVIHQEIQALNEHNDLGDMFDEAEDVEEDPVPILVKDLSKDDKKVPVLRQKLIQHYRDYQEKSNLKRYLQLVLIFVKIATKAPYPLEMLQNVANPYHIKILLQMLFQVSVECKLQILTIFQTLLRIQVPLSVFDEAAKDLKLNFRTQSQVKFGSSFAKFFYLAALQIQNKTWDSTFSENRRGGMHDVSVQLTRTVALCLKIQD